MSSNSISDLLKVIDAVSSDIIQPHQSQLSQVYPVIHRQDCYPVGLINPNINDGPWIAGGACLRWFQGLPVGKNDIDIFCASALQAARVIDTIKNYERCSVRFASDNAITMEIWSDDLLTDRWTLQIITKRYYSSAQEIIDEFDISVCQLATAGHEFVIGEFTAKDIREKNLRMQLPLQPDAVKRLTKYWVYGYRPVDGLIEDIQNNPNGRWTFEFGEDYS